MREAVRFRRAKAKLGSNRFRVAIVLFMPGRAESSMENLTRPNLSRRKFVQRSMMAGAATSLLPGSSHGQAGKDLRSAPPVPISTSR